MENERNPGSEGWKTIDRAIMEMILKNFKKNFIIEVRTKNVKFPLGFNTSSQLEILRGENLDLMIRHCQGVTLSSRNIKDLQQTILKQRTKWFAFIRYESLEYHILPHHVTPDFLHNNEGRNIDILLRKPVDAQYLLKHCCKNPLQFAINHIPPVPPMNKYLKAERSTRNADCLQHDLVVNPDEESRGYWNLRTNEKNIYIRNTKSLKTVSDLTEINLSWSAKYNKMKEDNKYYSRVPLIAADHFVEKYQKRSRRKIPFKNFLKNWKKKQSSDLRCECDSHATECTFSNRLYILLSKPIMNVINSKAKQKKENPSFQRSKNKNQQKMNKGPVISPLAKGEVSYVLPKDKCLNGKPYIVRYVRKAENNILPKYEKAPESKVPETTEIQTFLSSVPEDSRTESHEISGTKRRKLYHDSKITFDTSGMYQSNSRLMKLSCDNRSLVLENVTNTTGHNCYGTPDFNSSNFNKYLNLAN